MLDHERFDIGQDLHDLRKQVRALTDEVARLKAGQFTPEEVHGIRDELVVLHTKLIELGICRLGEFFSGVCELGVLGCVVRHERVTGRLQALEQAWMELKDLTKQYPAREWNDEYRKLASIIHAMGRDFFTVGRK